VPDAVGTIRDYTIHTTSRTQVLERDQNQRLGWTAWYERIIAIGVTSGSKRAVRAHNAAEGRFFKGDAMYAHRGLLTAMLLVVVPVAASEQGSPVTAAQASPFVGTWVFAMTNPAGSEQTVKIWDKNGVIVASLQVGKFPPTEVTGIMKDGDMLVLSVSHEARPGLRENGAQIWAVTSLTRAGDTMELAQMLEHSQTIKRGTGKKQAD
jgi:hypothetical protein